MKIPSTLVRTPKIKKTWKSNTDPQAQKVYLMERTFIGNIVETRHSHEYLSSVIVHICRRWKVKRPKLIFFTKGNAHVYGYCTEKGIYLNAGKERPGCSLPILIHEIAHWIVDQLYGEEVGLEHHGARFVTVYGKLMNDYKLFPASCWKVLCDEYGVEYVHDNTDSITE